MTIRIISPAPGATVTGTVTVLVDAPGVKRVNFYIDNEIKGRDQKHPFKFDWYTTNFPDGQHQIKAVSGDGHQASSVIVEVANVPATVIPPPTTTPPVTGKKYATANYGTSTYGGSDVDVSVRKRQP